MFWKSKETVRNEILEELKREDRERVEEEARIKEEAEKIAREKLEAEAAAKQAAEDALRASDEPWVEIRAIVPDAENGVKIELDWNDAFILYLKQNGYTGVDDEAIIQKYLATLTREIVESMDDEKASTYE